MDGVDVAMVETDGQGIVTLGVQDFFLTARRTKRRCAGPSLKRPRLMIAARAQAPWRSPI
jgi:hypothetical protein